MVFLKLEDEYFNLGTIQKIFVGKGNYFSSTETNMLKGTNSNNQEFTFLQLETKLQAEKALELIMIDISEGKKVIDLNIIKRGVK